MIGPEDEDLLAGGTQADEALHDDDADLLEAEQPDADEADGDDGQEAADEDGDDHGGEDAVRGDEGQAGQGQAQVKQPGRAQARVQAALAKAKAAEDRAAAIERRLAEMEQGRTQQQTAQQQAEERERLALMTPDERTDYLVNKTRQEFQGAFQGLQFQMQDNADRLAFDSLSARNDDVGRAYASVREDVEARLAEMRRNGGSAPRETIAKFLLGERAVQRLSRAKPRQQRKANDRIERQTARPGNNRSDRVQDGQRRGGDEKSKRADRLKDLSI